MTIDRLAEILLVFSNTNTMAWATAFLGFYGWLQAIRRHAPIATQARLVPALRGVMVAVACGWAVILIHAILQWRSAP